MSHPGDQVLVMCAEVGIDPDASAELVQALETLLALADEPAPSPSPELAALLRTAASPSARASRRPRRAAVATAVAAGIVVVTGVGAAADQLPAGVRELVSELVDRLLPFDGSGPAEQPRDGDSGEPTTVPSDPRDSEVAGGNGADGSRDDRPRSEVTGEEPARGTVDEDGSGTRSSGPYDEATEIEENREAGSLTDAQKESEGDAESSEDDDDRPETTPEGGSEDMGGDSGTDGEYTEDLDSDEAYEQERDGDEVDTEETDAEGIEE